MTRRGRKREKLTQAQKCAMGMHAVDDPRDQFCSYCVADLWALRGSGRFDWMADWSAPLDHDKIPQAR